MSSVPSAVKSTTGNQGPGGTGPYPIPPPPSQPKAFWDETSQPLPAASIASGLETSRLHTSHELATLVISSAFPLPLPRPVFKTLKGFQTVAGGQAVRPPPPVPRPQNSSPLRLRRGLGVVASQSLRKPSVPMHRDAPRYRGGERELVERASLGANVLCAGQGPARPAQFCVLLRGLRACAPCREA